MTADPKLLADLIPTNWLDPLLTGPDTVIEGYSFTCEDIARLLLAVKKRVAEEETRRHEASNEGWQPMATAPKDGSEFLIVCATDETPKIEVCDWYETEDWHWEQLSEDTYRKVVTGKRGSWNNNGHRATHWMPLPAAPSREYVPNEPTQEKP